jgi:hypothetical protein
MTVISANDLAFLRETHHRSNFYLSMLKPLTLWTAQVNDAEIEAGETEIVFDTGAGSHFAAIEAPQTLWVGTAAGLYDIGIIRIRGITSADSGVTGTVTVAAQNFPWASDLHLTFIHNYELWAVYPLIDPITEVFYKDRNIPFTDPHRPPVPILSLSSKAGFIRNGSLTFFVNTSFSYPIENGTTIVSYDLSCYPTAGTTVTFNTVTGIGRVKVTSLTQEYYWLKLTVEDSTGRSISTWRCVFAHDPDKDGATYPISKFQINQVVRSIGRGGTFAQVIVGEDDLSAVPKRAFTVLWKESSYGQDMDLGNLSKTIDAGDKTYINPSIGYEFFSIEPCEVNFTFTAGVWIDGAPAPDGTVCNLEFSVGGTTVIGDETTSGGTISIVISSSGGLPCTSTVTFTDTDSAVDLLTVPYSYLSTPVDAAVQPYPSALWVQPKHLAVGYLYRSRSIAELGIGRNSVTMDIVSIEEYMRKEFQFSVSLTSVDFPDVWYEFEADELTVGEGLFHLFYWHSTLFNIADVAGLDEDDMDLNYAFDFEEGNLYNMAASIYERVRRVLTTDRNGNIRFVPTINLLTDAERAVLDVTMTVENTDKGADLNFVRRDWRPAAFASVSGIYFDGTFDSDGNPTAEAFCAISPGSVPEYGGEAFVRLERQTLRSQTHANELAGRLMARENRDIEEIVVLFHGDYSDFLDPKNDLWAIDDDNNNLGISWNGQNLILDTVTVQVDVAQGLVTCYAFFEPEVLGRDGITTDCLSFPADPGGTPEPIPDVVGDGFGTVYVMTKDVLGRTRDFSAASPAYVAIKTASSESFYDFILDPWNPKTVGFLMSSKGVYRSTDLDQVSPTFTLIYTLANMESALGVSGTLSNYFVIKGSINVQGFFAFGVFDTTGHPYAATWMFVTTDSGDTWTPYIVYSRTGALESGTYALYVGGMEISPHLSGSGEPVLAVSLGATTGGVGNRCRFLVSSDGGVTWVQKAEGGIAMPFRGGSTDVHIPYAANSDSLIMFTSGSTTGLAVTQFLKSLDGGATWTGINPSADMDFIGFNRTPIQSWTQDNQQLYCFGNTTGGGGGDNKEFWHSGDQGATWTKRTSLGTFTARGAGGFPYNGSQFYVLGLLGIFVSIDGGYTWVNKTGNWAFGFTYVADCGGVIVPVWVAE